jgi:hypothetical protein
MERQAAIYLDGYKLRSAKSKYRRLGAVIGKGAI